MSGCSRCLTLYCLFALVLYYKHLMNVGFFAGSYVCPTPSITNPPSTAPLIGPSMPHCSTILPHPFGSVICTYKHFSTRFRGKASLVWSAADQLVAQITSAASEDWAWANNPQNVGRLETLVKDTKTSMSQFHRQFMTEDLTKLKTRYGEHTMISELTAFLSLNNEIKKIELLTKQLVKRHHM